MMMKLYIYNENCCQAGQSVPMSKIEAHDDPDNAGDWTCYEGTPEELLAIAAGFDHTDGAPGRANQYGNRVADTIREYFFFYHPELNTEND
jgi:hypothetical protein